MTGEKVKEAFDQCETLLRESSDAELLPVRMAQDASSPSTAERLNHLVWLCQAGKTLVDERRLEKAFRWLGFVQGAIWASGIVGQIWALKRMNMPTGGGVS